MANVAIASKEWFYSLIGGFYQNNRTNITEKMLYNKSWEHFAVLSYKNDTIIHPQMKIKIVLIKLVLNIINSRLR